MDSDTTLTAMGTQKHWQIRSLADPNPMDDIPDQDSAKITEKKVKTLFCLPEQDRGLAFGIQIICKGEGVHGREAIGNIATIATQCR